MTPDRWTLALDGGEFALPEGRTLVLQARGDSEFTDLGEVLCVQGFAPDHDRLEARGVPVAVEAEGRFEKALVQITKSKAGTMAAVAEALAHLAPGGLLMVDGQKEEGIEAIAKLMRKTFEGVGVYSKSHGKLVWLERPEVLPDAVMDWVETPEVGDHGYMTVPGGFSVDGPDRGSEILVALMPKLAGRVADLGAGWGYLAAEVLTEQEAIETLDLVEADHAMLEAARENVDDARARFHWADATRFTADAPYDAIICNPPFHVGRRADPSLGHAFIKAAARMLSPRGRFIMVANRHLPYEETLKTSFATGAMLGELEGYKIYEAAKPLTKAGSKPKRASR